MFESTNWKLEEENISDINVKAIVKNVETKEEILMVRRFEFSSQLQRMSVIAQNKLENKFTLNVKGSPEKIIELCLPNTIPSDFKKVLQEYTKKGYRVLGLAHKDLPASQEISSIQSIKREDAEQGLTFAGFLIMENKLKEITTSIIQTLKKADIKCVMITGDNLLTAVNVAKGASIVDANQKIYISELDEIPG